MGPEFAFCSQNGSQNYGLSSQDIKIGSHNERKPACLHTHVMLHVCIAMLYNFHDLSSFMFIYLNLEHANPLRSTEDACDSRDAIGLGRGGLGGLGLGGVGLGG